MKRRTFVMFSFNISIFLVSFLQICDSHSRKTPSGLYHDDGEGHTILTQKFSKKDVREISYDILNLMGFHHRPHPHLIDNKSPASQFLLEVYNSISIGETEDIDLSNTDIPNRPKVEKEPGANLTWSQFNVDREEVEAITLADSIVSFTNRGHRFSNRLKNYEEDKQFWFDVSEISDEDIVLGAELRIWKQSLVYNNFNRAQHSDVVDTNSAPSMSTESEEIFNENTFNGEVLRISVKQISPEKEDSFREIEVDEIVAAKWEQGWLRLNVTNSFKSWISDPTSNYGLVLSTKRADTGQEVRMKLTGLATILDTEEHQPFLVSFLKSSPNGPRPQRKSKRRTARSPSTTNNNRRNKKTRKGKQFEFPDLLDRPRSCQMGMLYVNFEDLGWKDWVIAPDGFIAYYCTGECSFPLTASMNATNHAIVSTLVHTYYPLEYPKPSCAPVKLGSISMLYYDDNSNVTVKKYKDMVIKSCGCK